MTEEQYKEVISLDKRLNELKGVYHMLDNNDTHLSYYKKGHLGNRDSLCNLEVKGEMESIKKQISEI